jgi:hypothetical protein
MPVRALSTASSKEGARLNGAGAAQRYIDGEPRLPFEQTSALPWAGT